MEKMMKTRKITGSRITLPADIYKRLSGKEVEIIETPEGVLLRPVEKAINRTRGFLKGKGSFTVEKFMNQKKNEKDMERL